MKKTLYVIVTIAVLGSLSVYFVPYITKKDALVSANEAIASNADSIVISSDTVLDAPLSVPTESSTVTTVDLKDGTYKGGSFANQFGEVQVEISIKDGKITAVELLSMPDGDSRSASISDYVGPKLKSATLVAQSAEIDTISGATYTSVNYIESLQSAIDQAKA